jgi:hypothetical protein
MRIALLLAFGLLCNVSAKAQPAEQFSFYDGTLEQLNREIKTNRPDVLLPMIAGAASAYTMANAELKNRKLPMLFCQPGNLNLMATNFGRFVVDELERNKSFYGGPSFRNASTVSTLMAVALLKGLQFTFPCN